MSIPAGRSRQAMDRLDVELVVDQLDDEHHDRARTADRFARGAQLFAVGARGLEAVMTVGEHQRRLRRRARRSRRCVRGRRSRRARGPPRRRRRRCRARCRARGARSGRRRGSGPRSDRRSPASRAAARAGRTSPWASCARGGARSCRRARAARARRSRPGCGAGVPCEVAELHAVRVEAGLGIDHEHAVALPRGRARPAARS